MKIPEKYQTATLPEKRSQAIEMAQARELWAEEARKRDQDGSAKEFELTALLLRSYADRLTAGF